MIRTYIGLGSNLKNPKQQLQAAIQALAALEHCRFITASGLYASQPMGPQDQPDYMNAVIALETSLEAHQLLDCTQKIELDQGRVRKSERWGPRTLDLDLLLYGDQVINSERLTIPHYGLEQREFVLIPLAEIAPELRLPGHQQKVSQLAAAIDPNGLVCIEDEAQWARPLLISD
ncbi:2-amino-4-hydroxy-6-hydroxymethyldihydropteridine diphosphokinase [Celerinatantimonas sp. YJH-8]|uniref:2-amino-4-hydroxy-6- hydroxymethyldihydropteridine diphosphokinase n=1 Tax=Celerinatantimonas sp. YJH-8 TaxID=3228714 RepID=UPI0038C2A0A4